MATTRNVPMLRRPARTGRRWRGAGDRPGPGSGAAVRRATGGGGRPAPGSGGGPRRPGRPAAAGARGGTARRAALELLDGGVPEDQVLDAVVAAEVDLRLGVVTRALHRHDRAKPVGVVDD